MDKWNRNNTSFLELITQYLKNYDIDNYSYLRYHQALVLAYWELNVARGIIIDHIMGSGKSVLGNALATMCVEQGYDAIVLLTKSLQHNFIKGNQFYNELRHQADPKWQPSQEWFEQHFSFVSMNASNMMSQVIAATESSLGAEYSRAISRKNKVKNKDLLETKLREVVSLGSLENKVVIVDEAHNLFRAITNGSENAIRFYNMVMKSKTVKIVFLTGTPISNDPFELVPALNMCAGKEILPPMYSDFYKYFEPVKASNETDIQTFKNKHVFQNRITGLISSQSALSSSKDIMGVFPEELPHIIELVPMESNQYMLYLLAREKEQEENKRSALRGASSSSSGNLLNKPKSMGTSSYRQRSRQISNWAMPNNLVDKSFSSIDVMNVDNFNSGGKIKKIIENITKHPNQLGLVYSQFIGAGGLGSLQRALQEEGWVKYSPPSNASSDEGESDEDESDEDVIGNGESSKLSDYTIQYTNGGWVVGGRKKQTKTAAANLTYAVISGEVEHDTRNAIIQTMISDENMHGAKINLLLVSSTGAEGIELKNIRHEHIMEPYWNYQRIGQVISRGIRSNSHIKLPKNEQNTQVYIYLSVRPEDEGLKLEQIKVQTTDIELYLESLKNRNLVKTFTDAIREVSIECQAMGETYCRTCHPTNDVLFHDDLSIDIKSVDPCIPIAKKEVDVYEITVDDLKYYYKKDEEDDKITVFAWDENLHGYKAMNDDDARVVRKAIKGRKQTKK